MVAGKRTALQALLPAAGRVGRAHSHGRLYRRAYGVSLHAADEVSRTYLGLLLSGQCRAAYAGHDADHDVPADHFAVLAQRTLRLQRRLVLQVHPVALRNQLHAAVHVQAQGSH